MAWLYWSQRTATMGKLDLDFCFIFRPLVLSLRHKTTLILQDAAKFHPGLRNLCTRIVESCQQIEKLHRHLQGKETHFWILGMI